MGDKLHEAVKSDGSHHSWMWVCPACDAIHQCDDRWTFSGSRERPTFRASVLVHAVERTADSVPGYEGRPRCHSYVTDGRIEYLSDSTHAFAGQTVDLPDWDIARPLGGASS